ncbi:hypothetical protein FQA39_LY05174 [Lamprigera yunnana]|nr:hypothetical protein FQA39_LY05174 [Lamprigera yunnana]
MTTDTVSLGFGYFRTISGCAKIGEEVANFAGIISAAVAPAVPKTDAFLGCAVVALIATAILILCYVTQITEKFTIPWHKIEFFFYVVWIVFYTIVSSFMVALDNCPACIAAGIFGYAAVLCYAVDAYYKFRLF